MNTQEQANILLVCTGNRFRSVSAELLLTQHLDKVGEDRLAIKSAGTNCDPDKRMRPQVQKELRRRGVRVDDHVSTKLTTDHIQWADTILAMADYHQGYIHKHFTVYAHLYNQFATGDESSVGDIEDALSPEERTKKAVRGHITNIIRHLDDVTPKLATNLCDRHFLFAELASGRRGEHLNGAEFQPLAENEHALAFLSLDVPPGEDSHVLVIPKDRFRDLHAIPDDVLADMQKLVQKIGSVFQKHYCGYNVILNNGRASGQFFYHAHYHIIPRNPNDGIEVEGWEHHRESPQEHRRHHAYIKQLLEDETND